MAKKKTKAETISEIPIEEIGKLSGESGRKKLESYVRTLRSSYKRRVGSFARKGLVSYAQIALEGSYPVRSQVQLTKMTRNQLILEFARYSKFFQDETSSEEGIKRVNREQDIRIFGADSRGRPKKAMSVEERTLYWQLYDEYKNQNPGGTTKYGSESVQQLLADAIFEGETNPEKNLVDFLNRLEQSLSEAKFQQNLRSVPNVYSGRGPFSDK